MQVLLQLLIILLAIDASKNRVYATINSSQIGNIDFIASTIG